MLEEVGMRDVVLQCVQVATSIWEVWLVYQTVYITILEKEYLGTKEKTIIWLNIIVLGGLLAVNRSAVFFSYVMLQFCVVVTSLCVWIIKRKGLLSIVGVILFSYVFVAILDFFFAFVSMEFLEENFKYAIYIHATSYWNSIIFICSRIIIWYIIRILGTKELDIGIEIQEYRWILLGMGFFLYGLLRKYLILMDRMLKGKQQVQGFDSGFSLLIVAIVILSVGLFLFKYQMLKKEKEILIIRESIVTEKYHEMLKTHQLVHDMKNHFIILEKYEKAREWEKLSKYIEEISGELLYTNTMDWTGNGILDFILSQKKAEMDQKEIVFHIFSVPLTELPFSDSEIISLFGNLLDNAIEACERI